MDKIYRNFFRNIYLKTGFTPAGLLNQNMYPGDFFQIRNGELLVLGNVIRNLVVKPSDVHIDYRIPLSALSWILSDGVTKPYSGRGSGDGSIEGEFQFSKQVLAFAGFGCFLFNGKEPEAVRIANWGEIQQQLIIRLTQELYSFRDLYVVTETATTSNWTLAVASSANAELELATDQGNFGMADIFGHHSSKAIQSKDIEFYNHGQTRRPVFFKAKKLSVQDDQRYTAINKLKGERQHRDTWAKNFFNYEFETSADATMLHHAEFSGTDLLDILRDNQFNQKTALDYFKWSDWSLDDIEHLY